MKTLNISETPFKTGDTFLDPNIGTAVRITGNVVKEVVRYGESAYFVDGEYIFSYGKPHQNVEGKTEIMLGTSQHGSIQWYGPATYRPTWSLMRMHWYVSQIHPNCKIVPVGFSDFSLLKFITKEGEHREYRKEHGCWDLYKPRYNKI
jgi:hypothetical protein